MMLCTVIPGRSAEESLEMIESSRTPCVELRADFLQGDVESAVKRVVDIAVSRGKRVIVTLRSRSEGGLWEDSWSKGRVWEAALDSGAWAVDVELGEEPPPSGRVILSSHLLNRAQAELAARVYGNLVGGRVFTLKIVWPYRDALDLDLVYRLTCGSCGRISAFNTGSGRSSVESRRIASLCGASIVYGLHPRARGRIAGVPMVDEMIAMLDDLGVAWD